MQMDIGVLDMGDWKPDSIEEDSRETESDLPPEFCHYRDEGCELFDSCLTCSLPQCIYDEPRGKQHWVKNLRNKEMVRLYTREGKGIKELALIFGISRRTVQRALKDSLLKSPRQLINSNTGGNTE